MKDEIKIEWTYTHYLNRKSKVRITKEGEYFGKIKHKRGYIGEQMAIVKFKLNKGYSKVPFSELIFVNVCKTA